MNIAVASGKGGTGKTTIAANLAVALAGRDVETVYADCDVEEPNGHIFLKPQMQSSEPVILPYPVIDEDICIGCGKCAEICQYKACIMIVEKPMVLPDMCHACGGCLYVCPVGAVSEKGRKIGVIESGERDGLQFFHGKIDVGQVLSPPVIREVKRSLPERDVVIIDCPPGTSCPVITAMTGVDYVLLVTEPTPFGLNDLKLAVDAVREMGIPSGVVLNRSDIGTNETITFCRNKGVAILGEIPYDERIAKVYSRGELIVEALPEYTAAFDDIYRAVQRDCKV